MAMAKVFENYCKDLATNHILMIVFLQNFLQNNLLPSGEKRKTVKTLVIDSVDRHEAGIYICEATNGVGVSHVKAEAKIKLQVLCEYFVCNLK